MNDAGLSNSPTPPRAFDVTDEQLSAELKRWTGATPALHPVGELLDRHWEAAFAYARLCTDGARAAGMLTTAAFTRLFGASLRQAGPTSAWRPQLLVTVRRIAAEWDKDGRHELLHPDVRSVGEGRAAARLLPPSHRRLVSGAFQRLRQSARALLWHTEVESEPLAIPAGLLGLDEEGARVELRRARERLREECLQVHRELADDDECLRYIRMLDVTYRRGGIDVDPDLQQHLNGCRHCRHTADQLNEFNAGLGFALAEAVLGWGAAEYVAARAAHAEQTAEPEPGQHPAGSAGSEHAAAIAAGLAGGEAFDVPAPAPAGGEPFDGTAAGLAGGEPFATTAAAPAADDSPARTAPASRAEARAVSRRAASRTPSRTAFRRSAPRIESGAASGPSAPGNAPPPASRRATQRAVRRARRRNLALAVATVSGLVVLPLVLWTVLGSGDGTDTAAGGKGAKSPGSGSPTTNPSWAGSSATAKGTLRGRLHNLASGLCVGVVGKKAVKGAETELAICSSAASQQWTYETDGLLRNAAAPDLCLDSHLGYSVQLAPCTAAAGTSVRYDFTLQGALVPRGDQDLALTPAATDGAGALVLKTRADTDVQRWVIDTAKPDLQMQNVNWDAHTTPLTTTPSTPATPKAAKRPSPTPTPSATASTPRPTPSSTSSTDPCAYNPYYCDGDGQDGGGRGYGPGYGSGSGFGHGRR
ncbi:ricin-type beta-trefoil lectin domain protein [Streptomyces sp. NPDC051636]|uniref:RICIN domain-containing protein n=1 Tax=Streptomyces sp. NPDC051636 TaxID=3365663 RepID=UPI0037AD7305